MNRYAIAGGILTLTVFGLEIAVGSVAVRPAVSRLADAQAET